MSAALVGVSASSASAWVGGAIIYYYHSRDYAVAHSYNTGARAGFARDDTDLANDYFSTEVDSSGNVWTDGNGQAVKNNAGSANNESDRHVRVFYNSYAVMGNTWNCGCSSYDTLTYSTDGYGVWVNLNNTYNENASHHQLSS